jgi:C-terminal processing protease CtpA/Prc
VKRPKVNDEEIVTSRVEPRWRGLLVILVDGDTAGAAEVIAAVLRTHLQAYVIGQQTKGEAAQFEDLPLGGGKVLRVAIGEVALPDNTPVFPGGLRPDLPVAVTQEKTDEVLVAALTDGVKSLVSDPVRQRFNEAALIAGMNPELDAAQERQKLKEKGEKVKAPIRDEVLVRALDYVTTIGIYKAGKKKR